MRSGPFSLSTDGSNDSSSKQFPLVIRCPGSDGLIHSEVLSLPICDGSSTGECHNVNFPILM